MIHPFAQRLALTTALLVLVALPHRTLAQESSTLSGPGQAWDEWRSAGGRSGAQASDGQGRPGRERRQDNEGSAGPNARINSMAGQVASGLGMVTGAATSDDAAKRLAELSAELQRRGMGRSQSAVDAVRRALERAGLLDPADDDSQPKVPSGNPRVPSSCEGNPACQSCYGNAIGDLDNTRWRLERLRAIYSSTYRYGKNMISLADGVSAVHGVSALAWQTRKIDVLKSLKNLDKAYDTKYEELITQLRIDLGAYSQCEATVMHVPDWFDRFGFVYYQFMKDHYKRPSL